jgi:hypothetical protein
MNDVWVFSNSMWSWLSSYYPFTINDISTVSESYPSTRCASTMWVWNSNLIIYGGFLGPTLSDTWLFNLDLNRWVFLRGPLTFNEPSVSPPLLQVTELNSIGNLQGASGFSYSGDLFVIGGTTKDQVSTDYIWRLNISSSFQCAICTPGFWSDSAGLNSTCQSCPGGTYSADYSTTQCSSCSPGSYSISGESECFICPNGTYSTNITVPCTACESGKFSSFAGSSYCLRCPMGFYSSQNEADGTTSCSICPAGFFSDQQQSSSCTLCPANSHCDQGSQSVKNCECKSGFYGEAFLGQPCSKCPAVVGATCFRSNLTLPYVAEGYFRTSPAIILKCIPSEACDRTGEEQNTVCGAGYTGQNCGDCVRWKYYRKGSGCSQCPSKVILGFQMTAIMLAVLVCLWIFSRSESGMAYEVKILLQTLQLISTYPSLNLEFPVSLSTTLSALSITNINIDIFSPECSSPMTFWEKFILKQSMPFLSMIGVLSLSILMKLISAKGDVNVLKNHLEEGKFMHMLFVIWSTVFIALFSLIVSNWASIFNCADQGGGVYTLVSNSSFFCYDALWKKYIPAIVLFGLVNLVIFPGALMWKLYQLRDSILTKNTQKSYAFLVGPYQPALFYWEMITTLKKTLIFLSLSVFQATSFKYLSAVFVQFAFVLLYMFVWPYKTDEMNRLNIT